MTPIFRRLARAGLDRFPPNGLKRTMLGGVRLTSCTRGCQDATETVSVAVGPLNTEVELRGPRDRALETIITHTGGTHVRVMEDGVIVKISIPGQSFKLPMGGKHRLSAEGDSGNLTVTTLVRCSCGVALLYNEEAGVVPPIGEFLL